MAKCVLPEIKGDTPHKDPIEKWVPYAYKKALELSKARDEDENSCVSAALFSSTSAAFKWQPDRGHYYS